MKYNKMAQLGIEVVRYSNLYRPYLIPGINIVNIRRELITIYAQRYVQKAGFKIKYYILTIRGNSIIPFSVPVAETAFVFMLKGRTQLNIGDPQNIVLDETSHYNLVVPAGTHKQILAPGEYHILYISLKEGFLKTHVAAYPFLQVLRNRVKNNQTYFRALPFSNDLQQMVYELKKVLSQEVTDIILDKYLFDAQVVQLLVHVLRAVNQHAPYWQQEVTHADSMDSALAIKTYIEQHFQEPITASSIAKAFNMALNKMNKLLKQQTEQHAGEYLMELRVKKVAHLLEFSDLTLAEIAQQTGFKNEGFLCGAFENTHNCLPLVYRARKRGTGMQTKI